jgi:acetyl esterase/lipase
MFPIFCSQYGTAEMLYSDSVELGKKVKEAGGSIELQEYPGAIHDWQAFAFLPEAHKAVKDIGAFINAQLGN